MDYEMEQMDDVPIKIRSKNEAIEDELINYSMISPMHTELYNAHMVYATEDGPKPKLWKAGKENGKTVYKIMHDNGDGLIFDWRKQHVRI
tara:strand:- start:1606 stop:1875 length:270 start_codon:yes stop_codon:yes gene_type:complete